MNRLAICLLAVSLGLFLLDSSINEALFAFLVAGVIPGTKFSLPPLTMLLVLGLGLWVFLIWTKRQRFYKELREAKATQKSKAA